MASATGLVLVTIMGMGLAAARRQPEAPFNKLQRGSSSPVNMTAWSLQYIDDTLEGLDLSEDPHAHALFFAFSHMGEVLGADAAEPREKKKLNAAAPPRGRRLSSSEISETYCEDMGINPDSTPTGLGFSHTVPSKPCTTEYENCPGSRSSGGVYNRGSIFALGDDAKKFGNGAGKLEYFVAWGWSYGPDSENYYDKDNWDSYVAICFHATYDDGLKINEDKEFQTLAGTDGAVTCTDCYLDASAKVSLAFHYVHNSISHAEAGVQGPDDGAYSFSYDYAFEGGGEEEEEGGADYYEDYEIVTNLRGDFDYNLDFKMEAPTFDLAKWQATDLPPMEPIGPYPVSTGVNVMVEGTGDLKVKGEARVGGGSVQVKASMDTDLAAWAVLEKDKGFDAGWETGVDYVPLSIQTTALEVSKNNDVSFEFAPKFPVTISASIGEYGAFGHKIDLSANLIVYVTYEIETRMRDDKCETEYQVDTLLDYEITAIGESLFDGREQKLPALARGTGEFCIANAVGDFKDDISGAVAGPGQLIKAGFQSGGGGGGDDDDDDDLEDWEISLIIVVVGGFVVFVGFAAFCFWNQAKPGKPNNKTQDPNGDFDDLHSPKSRL